MALRKNLTDSFVSHNKEPFSVDLLPISQDTMSHRERLSYPGLAILEGTFVLISMARFASRHLDIVAPHGGPIDRAPTLREYDRATLEFSLRGSGPTLVLSMRSKTLAVHDEKPPWPLPVFHFP